MTEACPRTLSTLSLHTREQMKAGEKEKGLMSFSYSLRACDFVDNFRGRNARQATLSTKGEKHSSDNVDNSRDREEGSHKASATALTQSPSAQLA